VTSTKDPYADLRSSSEPNSEPDSESPAEPPAELRAEPDVSDERRVQKVDRRELGVDRRDTWRVDVESSPRREKPERRQP
jgi:hypothetical protein